MSMLYNKIHFWN